jgi:hypothetical protein
MNSLARQIQLLPVGIQHATNASLPQTSSEDKLVTEHLPATRILLEPLNTRLKSTAFLFLKGFKENEVSTLTIDFMDVYGKPITESVDIMFDNQRLVEPLRVTQQHTNGRLKIDGLQDPPNDLYRISIEHPSYLPVQQFVRISSQMDPLELTFPVDLSRITKINFDAFDSYNDEAKRLLASSASQPQTAKGLFESYSDIQKAGFLNISEKAAHTRLLTGQKANQYFTKLRDVRGDRFFVDVEKSFARDVHDASLAGLFYSVPEVLHKPPEGFSHAGSYKSQDHYGNIQFTFHVDVAGNYVCDVDIDDAAGFEHIFQVIRNTVSGPTHPYNIHEILIAYQEIYPPYSFTLGTTPTLKVT